MVRARVRLLLHEAGCESRLEPSLIDSRLLVRSFSFLLYKLLQRRLQLLQQLRLYRLLVWSPTWFQTLMECLIALLNLIVCPSRATLGFWTAEDAMRGRRLAIDGTHFGNAHYEVCFY